MERALKQGKIVINILWIAVLVLFRVSHSHNHSQTHYFCFCEIRVHIFDICGSMALLDLSMTRSDSGTKSQRVNKGSN